MVDLKFSLGVYSGRNKGPQTVISMDFEGRGDELGNMKRALRKIRVKYVYNVVGAEKQNYEAKPIFA
jgi:hypothetical protein